MPKQSRPPHDWLAWGLLATGLIVALSVFSYDPPKAETTDLHPPTNLLGPLGDWVAELLGNALGVSVYVLLVSWFVLVIMLLMRSNRWTWTRRLLGWIVLLPLSSTFAEELGLLVPMESAETPAFGGGALGALIRAALHDNFPPAGQFIVLSTWLFVGALLAGDQLVLRFCKFLGRCSHAILVGLGHALLAFARSLFTGNSSSLSKLPALTPRSSKLAASTTKKVAEVSLDAIPINHPEVPALTQESVPVVKEPAPVILPISRPTAQSMSEVARFADFELPPLTLLEDPQPFPFEKHDQKLRELAGLLEKTFTDFELNVRVVGINTGPVITQYEVALETGLRLNKITTMADDLALNLKVPSVRIVAPIPGKNTVGIEVPNEHRAVVRLKEVILTAGAKVAKCKLPLFLGKDTEGKPIVYDLADMPHLLIAGRTGTGKSVCLNAIILSLLMTRRPDDVKMILIDPKMTELSEYGKIAHLMHPVVKDMKKAEAILSWAVDKMEERYDLLSRARVRGIAGYNELGLAEIHRRVQPDEDEAKRIQEKMPFIVIIIDEVGDLMMTMKREVEGHIIRLAQKSRAAGIHLVVATQKPTVDVITGLIKSNLPARICFQVSSRVDSRVVLDEMGAEKLLGMGDMLFLQPGTSSIIRAQGTYASDVEITRAVEHLECDQPSYATELIQLKTAGEGAGIDKLRARDEVYEQAVEIVVREGRGSVSLLQRALGIGYGRAARLIDFMAEDGIVGVYNGSNAREVLLTPEQWQDMKMSSAASA
jgi:S-DNA-T family DNA segregation ATPase FtsK/SpoIIIE